MGTRLGLTLLGGFQARLDPGRPVAVPSGKLQALLAYLALSPGQAHPRDKLGAILWSDLPKVQARKNLRQALFELRKALASAGVDTFPLDGEEVTLDPAVIDVDVAAFERGVAEGTLEALGQACTLYRGDLLEGLVLQELPFEDWLMAERERLRELAVEALARVLAHQHTVGAADAARQSALKLLALDPLQEPVHRTLMRLYADQGRRGAALRHYQHCVRVLQRELGVEPEAETKQLYQEILRLRRAREPSDDRALDAPAPATFSNVDDPATGEPPSAETPLIGRELELAQVHTALDRARRGQGCCLAIIGEAGVGKSRLVAEVAAEAAQGGAMVLVGRCYEAEQILPFGPWAGALRGGQVMRAAEALRPLTSASRTELSRLLPELGGPPESGGDYLNLFESVGELLRLLADRQLLVLVLEDLHWADEMSVRLLAFIARRLQPVPALILATVREEELSDATTLRRAIEDLSRDEHIRPLPLAPLSRADTVTLVRALTRPGRDDDSLDRLGEHVWLASEGNPFIAIESVRASQDGVTPSAPAGRSLPERVRLVMERRLERLGERSRRLVSVAAVIGREFDFALVQRAAGIDEAEAAEGLEELVRRRVLHGVGERFDFTHDAIRHVVLGQLLSPRRKLLHRRVANAMETLHASNLEPRALALGLHYGEGEVWDKAVRYLRLACAQAVARSANREAVACGEQALDALRHSPETRDTLEQAVDIRLDLHKALIPLGEANRTGAHLLEAETIARSLGDSARLGRVAAHLTNFFWLAGEPDRAVESGEQARAVAATLDDRALDIAASFYVSQAYHFRGDYRQAIAVLRRNMETLEGAPMDERFGLPGLAGVLSRSWLAWGLSEIGQFADGIAQGEEALAIAWRSDHPFSMADACRALGCVYLRQGEIGRAVGVLERGLELCRTRELALWFPSIASSLGYARCFSGRLEEGTWLLERAAEQATLLGIMAGQSLRSAWLSEAYLLGGRPTDALAVGTRSLELSRQRKERGNHAWTLRLVGDIASRRDPPRAEEAEDAYGQAIGVGEALGMRPLVAHCHLGLGTLHRRMTNVRHATDHVTAAMTMFGALGMHSWMERAQEELEK